MPKNNAQKSTAYHEAGHIVSALFSDHSSRIKSATISPNEDSLGHVAFKKLRISIDSDTPIARIRWEEKVIGLLAGGIAEKRYRGRANNIGAKSDYDKIIDIALYRFGSGEIASAYIRYCNLVAESQIKNRWELVTVYANALLQHKTLSGDEIRSILQEWLNQRQFKKSRNKK